MSELSISDARAELSYAIAQAEKKPVTIVRHGKPVARIVPVTKDAGDFVNPLKGSIRFEKDLVAPTGETWDAAK